MKLTLILSSVLLTLTTMVSAAEGTIDLLPDPASSPGYMIESPGSYVLVDNVTMTNSAGTCIQVTADNVTIDLNGHTISGPDGSPPGINTAGILLAPGYQNLTVRNGYIKGFGEIAPDGTGIRSNGSKVVLSDLTITDCAIGISLGGSDSSVENVIVSNCDIGISLFGHRNYIRNSQVLNSTAQGIGLSNTIGCRVESNLCSGNGGPGIGLNGGGSNNWITGNTVTNNYIGISNVGGAYCTGNQASGNTNAQYTGISAALIVSLGSATAPPPATANLQP